MPYIMQERRSRYSEYETMPVPKTPGDLNYVLTRLILRSLGEQPHYEDYNSVIGVLESCKLELYRRQISPYEDLKRNINGDVFEEEY